MGNVGGVGFGVEGDEEGCDEILMWMLRYNLMVFVRGWEKEEG